MYEVSLRDFAASIHHVYKYLAVLFNKINCTKDRHSGAANGIGIITMKIIFKRVICSLYPLGICNIDIDLCYFKACNLFQRVSKALQFASPDRIYIYV